MSEPIRVIFDRENPNWFHDQEINMLFLRTQENYANDLLRARGYVFVNEIHGMLGLPYTAKGQLEGWLYKDRESYISFGIWDKEIDNDAIELELNSQGVMYDKIES